MDNKNKPAVKPWDVETLNFNPITLFAGALVMLPLVIFEAFILKMGWQWFVATQFGLAELGLIQAMGISIVIGVLIARPFSTNMMHLAETKDQQGRTALFALLNLVTAQSVLLLMMWVLHSIAS